MKDLTPAVPFVKDLGNEQMKNSVSALMSWLFGGL